MVKTAIGSGKFDLVEILLQGPDVWNQWRSENLDIAIELKQANLYGANLDRANLDRANLEGALLNRANLRGANLRGASLREANLEGAILYGANLYGAILDRANLYEAILEGANLYGAILKGANLIGANLKEVNLYGAILYRANLIGANLIGTNLKGANLIGAILDGAILGRANLYRANLGGATLDGAILYRANLDGANLDGANLIGANLEGATFEGANLKGAILDRAILRGASLYRANLEGTKGLQDFALADVITESANLKIFDEKINQNDLEQLQSAIAQFAEACGYENPEIISTERGSFFQTIKYIATTIPFNTLVKGFKAGKNLFTWGRDKIIQTSGNEYKSTKDIAEATATLLQAVDKFDNVVLTLGRVMVVKKTANGESLLYATTISVELKKQLESNPIPTNSPQDAIDFLSARSALPVPMMTKAIEPASEVF